VGPVQELGGVNRSRERAVLAGAELSIACLTALGWVLSYSTLQRLAASHGYSGWEARLWPLTVDFLVLASTLIAMLTARRGSGPTGEAWLLAGAATAATLAGNVLGAGGDPVACAMHAWPALCMVGAWHLFFRSVIPAQPAREAERRVPAGTLRMATPSEDPALSPTATVPDGRSRSSVRTSPARQEAERIVRQALAEGREPTAAEVARVTGRSARQARRLVAGARLATGQGQRVGLAVLEADGASRLWPDPATDGRGGIA
jgi:hypothetical protein